MKKEYDQERLTLLYQKAYLVVISPFLIALVSFYILWEHKLADLLSIWLGLEVLSNLFMLFIWLSYRKACENEKKHIKWLYLYNVETFIQGLLWGGLGYVSSLSSNPEIYIFTLFVLGGQSAGAVMGKGYFFSSYAFYAIPALLPIIYTLFISNTDLHFTMAMLTSFFLVFMLHTAHEHSENIKNTISLWLDNKTLLNDISNAKDDLELINSGLNSEIFRRKRIEDELRMANQAKSHFLASVSHETRTPLTGILSYSELMERTPLNDKQKRYLKNIRGSADNLLQLINDILDNTKIETGKITLENKPFHLLRLIDEVVEPLSFKASENRLSLSSILKPNSHLHLSGDDLRIKQILINIINNAIKHTRKGGINLVCETLPLADKVRVSFTIIDTGVGIEQSRINSLFQPFTQLDSPDSGNRLSGVGLGLNIAKNLTQAMNGNIDITSQEGKGTTITIQIDLESADNYIDSYDSLRDSMKNVSTTMPGLETRHIEALGAKLSYLGAHIYPESSSETKSDLIIHHKEQEHADNTIPSLLFFASHTEEEGDDSLFITPATSVAQIKEAVDITLKRFNAPNFHENHDEQPSSINFKKIKLKVLLVEDNHINRKALHVLLDQMVTSVDEAITGEESIKLCLHNSYDIIFMDINLPGISGIEAQDAIRKVIDSPTRIIALTAHAFEDNKNDILNAGFDDILIKPALSEQLEAMLHKWANKEEGADYDSTI